MAQLKALLRDSQGMGSSIVFKINMIHILMTFRKRSRIQLSKITLVGYQGYFLVVTHIKIIEVRNFIRHIKSLSFVTIEEKNE